MKNQYSGYIKTNREKPITGKDNSFKKLSLMIMMLTFLTACGGSSGGGAPSNDPDGKAQLDTDLDGIIDTEDSDDDNDGANDDVDAFPLDANESLDTDSDGIGNNTDTDDDNDTALDISDAFPLDANESVDTDNDGIGNHADTDDDNDTVLDVIDAFPLDANESMDSDNDGVGNNTDTDDDNDGVLDLVDAFPLDGSELIDTDNDGTGNNADTDDDNDTVLDIIDEFPLDANESVDTDNDGTGNNADTDDDNDTVLDIDDAFPLNAAASVDTDEDGLPDDFNESCNESCQAESGLTLDNDDDNDSVLDIDDAFPLDTNESVDTDQDGTGNNADTDDDNDTVLDSDDDFPLNAAASLDTDKDGLPDDFNVACNESCQVSSGLTLDVDDDNDGVPDEQDDAPKDASVYDLTAPFIVSNTPVNGDTSLAQNTRIIITFSEAILSNSVTADSITLTYDGGATNFALLWTEEFTVLELVTSNLEKGREYTVAISGITDQANNSLANTVQWKFQTQDFVMDSETTSVIGYSVNGKSHAENSHGDKVVAWFQLNSASLNYGLWVKLFNSESGWDSEATKMNTLVSMVSAVSSAIDEGGNALLVWRQKGEVGSNTDIWANYYDAQAGAWNGAELIESRSSATSDPIAIISGNNFVVLWPQFDTSANSNRSIVGNRYDKESGTWQGLLELDQAGTLVDSDYLQVGSDQLGNLIMVWAQRDGNNKYQIMTSNYNSLYEPASGSSWAIEAWSTPVMISDADLSVNFDEINLSVNKNGQALVAWNKLGSGYGVFSSAYSPDSDWSEPVMLTDSVNGARAASVSIDKNGNGHMVWKQYDGESEDFNYRQIWTAQLNEGLWSEPLLLIERDTSRLSFPSIKSDIDGRALLLWEESSGDNDGHYWQRYLPYSGWSNETLFSTDTTSYNLNVIMKENGEASISYRESGIQYRTFN